MCNKQKQYTILLLLGVYKTVVSLGTALKQLTHYHQLCTVTPSLLSMLTCVLVKCSKCVFDETVDGVKRQMSGQ